MKFGPRTLALSVLAALLVGGIMGVGVARRPTKVTESSKTSSSWTYDMREDWAHSFNFTQHTPPKETVRWYRKYVPGAKPGECKIAEEGGEHEKIGPGVITGEGKSSGSATGAATGKAKTETTKITQGPPTVSFAVLFGLNQELEPQAQANGSVRVWGPLTINAALCKSFDDDGGMSFLAGPGVSF